VALILSISGIMSGRLYKFIKDNGKGMWYIYPESNIDAKTYALEGMASYYILCNSIVPLSMVIILELSKSFYSKMIEWDA